MLSFLIVAATGVVSLLLAAAAYYQSPKAQLNRFFLPFALSNAFWALANFMTGVTHAPIWVRMQYAAGALLLTNGLIWFDLLLKRRHRAIRARVIYITGAVLFSISLFTPWIIKRVDVVHFGWFEGEFGPLFSVYTVIITAALMWLSIVLIRAAIVSRGLLQQQMRYVAFGAATFNVIATLVSFVLPLFGIRQFSQFDVVGAFIFVLFTFYSMSRFRLMDIRQLISRSLVYALLVATIILAFTFVTSITGALFKDLTKSDSLIVNLVVSFIIVLGLEPLKAMLGKATDKIFYQARIDYADALRTMSNILSVELDTRRLVTDVTKSAAKLLKLSSVDILLLRGGSGFVSLVGSTVIPSNTPVIVELAKHEAILAAEELRRRISDAEDPASVSDLVPVSEQMAAMKAGMIVPVYNERELRAIIFVGERLSGGSFTVDDLNLFQVLAPQLSAALQKSQLYSEVQDYSANLQKKVESATARLQEVNGLLATRNDRLNTLQKFANVILQSYRLEEMSQRIIDYIPGEIPGCDMAVLVMVDEQKRELYGRSISQPYAIARQIIRLLGTDLTKYRVPLSNRDNLLTKVVSEKKMQKTADLYDFLRPGIAKPLVWALQNVAGAMREAVAVPLTVRGQVTGILIFVFGMKRPPLTDEDYLLLQAVADQVGIALERTRVYDELEKLNGRLNEANHYLQQLDKAKSEFLSIASHQLRTPTTGIKGFLSMMLEGDYGQVTKEQREVLQTVYDSTNRLIRLVNVFLNVSRIESGRLQLARSDIDLAQLAKVVVTELRPAAKARGLTLELQAPEHVATVPADSDKIRDVLVNLADNAIKYTEHGSVTVRVAAHPAEVEVAVSDTGMGLSADEIKALFAKFSRGERVKIKESQGSGLGLFIAKKIIEAHAGKIWVTSPGPGKGTTFYFTLPTKPPKDADAGLSTMPTDTGSKPVGK